MAHTTDTQRPTYSVAFSLAGVAAPAARPEELALLCDADAMAAHGHAGTYARSMYVIQLPTILGPFEGGWSPMPTNPLDTPAPTHNGPWSDREGRDTNR